MVETEPKPDVVNEADRLAREAWAASYVMRSNRVARENKILRRRLLAATIGAVPLSIIAFMVGSKIGAGDEFAGSTLVGVGLGLLGWFVLAVMFFLRSMYARVSDLEDRVEQAHPQAGAPPEQR